jgi:hypothetical protein
METRQVRMDIKGGQRIMWKFKPVEKASEGIQVETA